MASSASSEKKLASVEAKLNAHTARHDATVPPGDRVRLGEQRLDWKFLTPLVWAPAFPIIRHSTARLPQSTRNLIIAGAIVLANLHGFWLINNPDLSDEALGIERKK